MDRNRELTSEKADGVASRAGGPSGLLIDAYREARQALRAELEHHPGYADLRQRLGLLHLALGEWPEAQASFEEALGIHPGYRAAYYGLRASLLLQGALDPRDEPNPPGDAPQTDEALWREIDRAYRDEASGKSPEPEGQALPGLVRSHYAAAFAARRGDAAAARRHLLEASRESPTSARILAEAGLLRPEDEEIGDGALEALRSLLWLPFAEELYGYIGRTYAAGGMRAEAMASFDRAYLVRPSGAALACRQAEAAAHFGEEDRVLSLLREAVAAEPGYARAHRARLRVRRAGLP